MRKIIIAGGKGFLGSALEKHFEAQGDQMRILTRKPTKDNHIFWDGRNMSAWSKELDGIDILINLSGKSVDCRYNASNKKAIVDSRIQSTQALLDTVSICELKPKVFINASSSTIYIHAEEEQMTEANGRIGDDFSMNVVKDWEACFFKEEIEGVRKVALRTSIVFGEGGGAFPKLKRITSLGMGGKQGNGNQMVSWIHIEDFCNAVEFIITSGYLEGAINVTAPTPVTNKDFMSILRKVMKPLFYLNQSKLLLEFGSWLIRTETELLLKSRNVIPKRLLDAGFRFKYPHIEVCLRNLETK